jgi:hypothetical protein
MLIYSRQVVQRRHKVFKKFAPRHLLQDLTHAFIGSDTLTPPLTRGSFTAIVHDGEIRLGKGRFITYTLSNARSSYCTFSVTVLALYSPSGGHAVKHGSVDSVTTIGRLSYVTVQVYKRNSAGLFRARWSSKAGRMQLNTFAHVSPDALLCVLPRGCVEMGNSTNLTLHEHEAARFKSLSERPVSIELIKATKALAAARRKGGNGEDNGDVE